MNILIKIEFCHKSGFMFMKLYERYYFVKSSFCLRNRNRAKAFSLFSHFYFWKYSASNFWEANTEIPYEIIYNILKSELFSTCPCPEREFLLLTQQMQPLEICFHSLCQFSSILINSHVLMLSRTQKLGTTKKKIIATFYRFPFWIVQFQNCKLNKYFTFKWLMNRELQITLFAMQKWTKKKTEWNWLIWKLK